MCQVEIAHHLKQEVLINVFILDGLKTANSILRLYVTENEPSAELFRIVKCIMKVYIPVWFTIKKY